ncbi:SDR family oxidoreductase [Xanthocytophaga flavus]|nr:SDR family NAD(P)-dependent oxidoreductase [Xanthocytophaga flavus]
MYKQANNYMQLTGNKILITGATSGIGKALTLKFLELDNQIIAVGRNRDRLNELVSMSNQIIPFECDVSQTTDLNRLVTFVEQKHTDTNILINNAGIQYNYDFEQELHLINKIEHEVQVNLLAPLKLTALLWPILQLQPNVAVVNVSSGLGLVPKMQAPVYCATKAGIHIFSKALRDQSDKIRIFEIIPPLVDTEMTKGRGKGKISPEKLVNEFIRAFGKDHFEISIGKVKLLKLINRLSPALAEKIMNKGI